jgi:P-type E1-E2 ATPase
VFLGAFGLKDSLREKVKSAISYATGFSNINIRMVSGDHYDTAVKVAEISGIITEHDGIDLTEKVMTGD